MAVDSVWTVLRSLSGLLPESVCFAFCNPVNKSFVVCLSCAEDEGEEEEEDEGEKEDEGDKDVWGETLDRVLVKTVL